MNRAKETTLESADARDAPVPPASREGTAPCVGALSLKSPLLLCTRPLGIWPPSCAVGSRSTVYRVPEVGACWGGQVGLPAEALGQKEGGHICQVGSDNCLRRICQQMTKTQCCNQLSIDPALYPDMNMYSKPASHYNTTTAAAL